MDALRLANTALAIDIFKLLCEKNKTGNIIFSPLCISSSLALAYKGSKGNTATELEKVLHFEKVKDCDFGFQTLASDISKISSFYSLKLVKRLYIENSFNCTKEFINSAKKPYPAELEVVDIKSRAEEARNQINTSIKDLTDSKIETALSEGSCDENTKLILLGAAYFKGSWLYKFNESETKEVEFHISKCPPTTSFPYVKQPAHRSESRTFDWTYCNEGKSSVYTRKTFDEGGQVFPYADTRLSLIMIHLDRLSSLKETETKPVQMMYLEARLSIGYINELKTLILEIPYTAKHLSMIILLPKNIEDNSTGLEKLEHDMTFEKYVHWTNPSMMANSKVKLCLPKFKLENSFDLKDILKSLGVNDAFNEEAADFSGMSESKGIALSQAIQKACIEVNEDGTETADVTRERLLMHKEEFHVDHPFIFMLRHNKTRTILMYGRYCCPSEPC